VTVADRVVPELRVTEVRWTDRWALALGAAAYAALTALFVTVVGVPGERVTLLFWLWVGSLMLNWRAPVRHHLEVLRAWGPAALVLVAWMYTRSIADNLGMPIHVRMPIDVDSWLGHGRLPTERLQAALCGGGCGDPSTARWYDTVFTATYFTHFVCGIAIAVVLWLRSREAWSAWMRRYLWFNVGGLAIYVLYPMVPPWMASQDGEVVPAVVRLTGRGGSVLNDHLASLVFLPVGNDVAAMPSLHAGTALLVALFGVRRLTYPARWLLLAYPLTMGAGLVYLGEHYVVDVLAGFALAVVVSWGCEVVERRRRRRSAGAGEGGRSDHASAGPAYVAGELAVLGDDDHHTAGWLGRDQLTDDVVGDHPAGAEQHLDPAW
jgi:membrane-associated phospholipid phosphatase